MIELKNEKIAVPIVLLAGILWSFGPLVVRYMNDPHMVPWQYIFGRGLTIFIILNLYLYFEEGINFYKNYKKIGKSGLIGGVGLGIAIISFIYSITNTNINQFLMLILTTHSYNPFCNLIDNLHSCNEFKIHIALTRGELWKQF